MKKKLNYLLTCIFVFSLAHSFAQKKQLTLQEAYKAASHNYPGIDVQKAKIEESKYHVKYVTSKSLPQANIQVQNTLGTLESSPGGFFPLPGQFNINGANDAENSTAYNTYASLVADWEIYSFGKLNKEKYAAELQVSQSESGLKSYEVNLKGSVSRLFFGLLYHKAKLDWASKNTARLYEVLTISTGLAAAGLKPGADTSLASSSYSQIQSDMNLWNGLFKGSKHHLNEFTAIDEADIQVNTKQFMRIPNQQVYNGEQSASHPFLDQVTSGIKVKDALMDAKGRSVLPSLSLLGGVSSRGTDAGDAHSSRQWRNGFDNGKSNYLVGFGIKWNLTGIHRSKIEQKQIGQQKRKLEAELEQTQRKLNAAVQSSHAQLIEQNQQVINTETGVLKAQEAYRLYRTRYENGLINLTELLQIQSLLQEAEDKQLHALKGYWAQLILQAEATGNFESLFETVN